MLTNIPEVKLGIIAVSRDCFIIDLSERRRSAIVSACARDGLNIYECKTTVENEKDMLKAVDASKKPLENIFRTVRVQRRVQDVEEKLQVREALSVRPDPKSREKGSKSTNFFSRRKPD